MDLTSGPENHTTFTICLFILGLQSVSQLAKKEEGSHLKSASRGYHCGPRGVLLALLLFAFSARPAVSQVLYGSVVGTVTDPSGATVPGATVTITGKTTGAERSDKTDAGGRYSFVNVLPGTYDLKVSATGFRSFAAMGFDISPNTVQRIDSKLEVGQISEQVTVEGTTAVAADRQVGHAFGYRPPTRSTTCRSAATATTRP